MTCNFVILIKFVIRILAFGGMGNKKVFNGHDVHSFVPGILSSLSYMFNTDDRTNDGAL